MSAWQALDWLQTQEPEAARIALSEDQPTILILEDLQRADESMREFEQTDAKPKTAHQRRVSCQSS
jgi:hypothetical protein